MQKIIKLSRGNLPIVLTAAVMAIFYIAYLIFPVSAPGTETLLSSEFRRQYQLESSYDQRMAFLLSLVVIAGFSTAAFFVGQLKLLQPGGQSGTPKLNAWISLFATLAGLSVYATLIQSWIVISAAALAACFFLFAIFSPCISRKKLDLVAMLIIGVYLSIVIVPGFFAWPISFPVADANSVAQIELHLTSLVQPGSAIAAGLNIFREIPYGYGLLMPSIVSVLERYHGPLSVGDHALFVQYCQVAFAITAALAYFCYRPRNYVGILVALLLAAPYWSSSGLGIWHPNQTGFRSLSLPLGILALALAGRYRPNNAAWALGCIGMVAALINVETTVAVAFGYIVYLSLRTRRLPIVAIVRMSIGGVAVFASYLILYRYALGRLPFGIDSSTLLTALREHATGEVGLRLFNSGYWRENYYLVPIALIMFAHASYVVIAAYQKLGDRMLSHHQALRAGVATILIIWFAYYINSPNWWQIWTLLFLYGFFVIDLFDPRLFSVGTARLTMPAPRRMRSRLTHVVQIVLLSIAIFHTNSNLAFYTRDFLFPYWTRPQHDVAVLSDMQLPVPIANALQEKSKMLADLNTKDPGKVVYLTYNVEFVPMLTRIFEAAPQRSLWGYVAGDGALDPAIAKIFGTKPVAILIDAPSGPLAIVDGPRKDFQERVRKSVSREYHIAETASGWQIWRPNTP